MTESQQRDALAEVFPDCLRFNDPLYQWQYHDGEVWRLCKDNDPLRDLNAMHAAWLKLDERQQDVFAAHLGAIVCGRQIDYGAERINVSTKILGATAAQWAKAFLLTLGKWKD